VLCAILTTFAFVDIACGDASQMREVLPGTRCRHYHGIDLSAPALELAAKNMADATFEVELDHEDFVEALTKRPEPADAAWCSLSMHHLPTEQKRGLFEAIRAATPLCMIYEPTLQAGESREEYPGRFRRVNRPARGMGADRPSRHHVRSAGNSEYLGHTRPGSGFRQCHTGFP